MLDEEWDSIDREKRESILISSHIDGELFPVINPDNVHQPDVVFRRLEEKISVSFQTNFCLWKPVGRMHCFNIMRCIHNFKMQGLPRQKMISDRFSHLVTKVEEMRPRLRGREKEEEAERMLSDLKERQRSLQVRSRCRCNVNMPWNVRLRCKHRSL